MDFCYLCPSIIPTVHMKRILVLLIAMAGLVMSANAIDYHYLTFETTDGEKASVDATSLTLTFSGTTLTAGTQSFTLSNLKRMYFTVSDESTTGFATLSAPEEDAVQIYDLNGRATEKGQMRDGGVYVVKTKSETYKVIKK